MGKKYMHQIPSEASKRTTVPMYLAKTLFLERKGVFRAYTNSLTLCRYISALKLNGVGNPICYCAARISHRGFENPNDQNFSQLYHVIVHSSPNLLCLLKFRRFGLPPRPLERLVLEGLSLSA